jgi:hypothetical protein
MLRNVVFLVSYSVTLVLLVASAFAAQFGTAEEAKAISTKQLPP